MKIADVGEDLIEISKHLEDKLLHLSEKFIQNTGSCIIALSGGNTPRTLYQSLRDKINSHYFFIQVDERWVNSSDKQSNSKMIFETLHPQNFYRIPAQVGTPEDVAKSYETTLRKLFIKLHKSGPDIVLLGLGEDGHTASLFPNSSVLKHGELAKRLVLHTILEDQKSIRITLTPTCINLATHKFVLATGSNKGEILRRITQGENYPISLINDPDYYLDKAAFSSMQPSS